MNDDIDIVPLPPKTNHLASMLEREISGIFGNSPTLFKGFGHREIVGGSKMAYEFEVDLLSHKVKDNLLRYLSGSLNGQKGNPLLQWEDISVHDEDFRRAREYPLVDGDSSKRNNEGSTKIFLVFEKDNFGRSMDALRKISSEIGCQIEKCR